MDSRLTGLDLKTSALSIADLVFPRVCIACGVQLLPEERHLCMECMSDVPFTRFENSPHNPMADSLNENLERKDYSGPYVYASSLFHYSGNFRKITRELKYRRNFGAGKFFASELSWKLSSSPVFSDADCVVPVPLHWTRRWVRGYNQAGIIGREIASVLDARFCPGMLRRCRRTGTQVLLSGEGREKNVSGAFEYVWKGNLAGIRHILLVDDVYTTEATLVACFLALREKVPLSVRISVISLAYVG